MLMKIIVILMFLISTLYSVSIKSNLSKGKEIYQICSICHGENGKKKALGVSLPINGRDTQRLIDELNGYKNKTLNIYGMGDIMLSIMPKLSIEDIKDVSKYINSMTLIE